jgi:hypothetical protein
MKLVEPMVFAKAKTEHEVSDPPLSLYGPAWILIAGSVYLGVDGGACRQLVELASRLLEGLQ